MESIYRIVNTINHSSESKNRGSYTLQFVEYIDAAGGEPLELVKNSVELGTGCIFRDALNMSEGKAPESFEITLDTTFDYARYIEFIGEICSGLSPEAMKFCYELYGEFYQTGRARDAYVPTMNVRLELDCSQEGYLVEYFYFEDFENLLVYDFYAAIKEKRAIKCCARCGAYFLTEKRTDQIYCSADCKSEVSKERSRRYHSANGGGECEILKRRIASRLQQRTNVTNQALREDRIRTHKEFLSEVRQWKQQLARGETTENLYLMWLEKQDRKYASLTKSKDFH